MASEYPTFASHSALQKEGENSTSTLILGRIPLGLDCLLSTMHREVWQCGSRSPQYRLSKISSNAATCPHLCWHPLTKRNIYPPCLAHLRRSQEAAFPAPSTYPLGSVDSDNIDNNDGKISPPATRFPAGRSARGRKGDSLKTLDPSAGFIRLEPRAYHRHREGGVGAGRGLEGGGRMLAGIEGMSEAFGVGADS